MKNWLYHLHKVCLIHLVPKRDCEILTKRMSPELEVKIQYI